MADHEFQTSVMALQNVGKNVVVRSNDPMDVQYLLNHPSYIDVSAECSDQYLVTSTLSIDDSNID